MTKEFSQACAEYAEASLKKQLNREIKTVYYNEDNPDISDGVYAERVREANKTISLLMGGRRLEYDRVRFRLFIDRNGIRKIVQGKDEVDLE